MADQENRNNLIGGILLLIATILAMGLQNSSLSWLYDLLLSTRIDIRVAPESTVPTFEIAKPLTLWINDGLMAVFFFYVGMEIKREVLIGHLAKAKHATLPVIGAIGGVVVPVFIFWLIARRSPEVLPGLAIPMATDIAFAVAVAVALGRAVPPALKAYLLALAIIDDLMAIVVIAVFYTTSLSYISMALGLAGVAMLAGLNLAGVRRLAPYLAVGIFTWACVLKSGVHATLAGVALGFALPLTRGPDGESLLERTEHDLKPWVAFFVMPIFAFANAGVDLTGVTLAKLFAPLPLGIAAGLFIGKQIGIYGICRLAVMAKLGELPQGITWLQFYGAATLCGVGFTMSLFIGSLAFDTTAQQADVRLGVLVGSLLSAVMAIGIFILAKNNNDAPQPKEVRV